MLWLVLVLGVEFDDDFRRGLDRIVELFISEVGVGEEVLLIQLTAFGDVTLAIGGTNKDSVGDLGSGVIEAEVPLCPII